LKVLCYLPEAIQFQNKLGMITRSAGVQFQPFDSESEIKIFAEKETEKDFFVLTDIRNLQFIHEFSNLYPESTIVVILFETTQPKNLTLLNNKNIESFVATNKGEFDAISLLTLLK
jgi:hypothetical protein